MAFRKSVVSLTIPVALALAVLQIRSLADSEKLAASNDMDVPIPKFEGYPSIQPLPLKGRATMEVGKNTPLEEMNQCPGTVQHYKLPPVGYIPPESTEKSARGQELYGKFNCASCHAIDEKGGTLGPPLDGIGGHRGKQWLVARLLNPEEQMREFPAVFGGRPNIMPHISMSKREAGEIADYLLTLPEPKGGFLITAHPMKEEPIKPPPAKKSGERKAMKESIEEGKQLFIDKHCAMCHTIDSPAGRFGPRLSGLSAKYNSEQLDELLSGGANDIAMQSATYNLDKKQRQQIIDFLLSLPPSAEPMRNLN